MYLHFRYLKCLVNKRPLTTRSMKSLFCFCSSISMIQPLLSKSELACYWPVSCKSSSSISGFGNLFVPGVWHSWKLVFNRACQKSLDLPSVLDTLYTNDPKENKAKSNTVSFTNHSPKSWLTKQLKKKTLSIETCRSQKGLGFPTMTTRLTWLNPVSPIACRANLSLLQALSHSVWWSEFE